MNGKAHKFKCAVPSKLTVYVDDSGRVMSQEDGGTAKEIDQFAMGGLAGFLMALDDMTAQGWKGFELHDQVWIKCTGEQPATQAGYSAMLLFSVEVQ